MATVSKTVVAPKAPAPAPVKSSAQANIDAFNRVQQQQNTGSQFISGQGVVPVQSSSSSSSSPVSAQLSAVSRSIGGGGSSSSSTPSSVPAAQLITPAPVSGTAGNPAGSKLPTGTVTANAKAAQSAASMGPLPKQKEDWQSTLASVQAANHPTDTSSTYGMTKDPNAIAPVAAKPKSSLLASASDAFSGAYDALKNMFGGSSPSNGMEFPVGAGLNPTQTAQANQVLAKNSQATTTASPSFGYSPSNVPNNAPAIAQSSAPTPQPSSAGGFGTLGDLSINGTSNTAGVANSQVTPTQTTPSSGTPTTNTPITSTAPTQTSPASVSISNIAQKKSTLDQTQAAAGVADETKKQADAAQNAADTAANEEDRKYYQGLADQAKQQADDAEAEYQRLLQPSADEQATQDQLNSELQSLELGKTDVAGQAIPLAFIGGQQAALEKRSALRTAPLQSKLGQLQAARQAAMQGAKQRVGTLDNRYDTASSNLFSVTEQQKKREQELQDAATKQANDRQVLSTGQQMFDSKGNLIASGTPKVSTTSTPSGVKPNTYKDPQQVPADLRNSVLDDIVMNQGTLPDIIKAYPEISSSAIEALFNQFSMSGKGLNPSTSREL